MNFNLTYSRGQKLTKLIGFVWHFYSTGTVNGTVCTKI